MRSSSRPGVVHDGGVREPGRLVELAESVFSLPVRRGLPIGVGGPRRRGEQPHIRDGGGPDPPRVPGEQREKAAMRGGNH